MGFLREEMYGVTIEERRESFVVHTDDPDEPSAEFSYDSLKGLIAGLLKVQNDEKSRFSFWAFTHGEIDMLGEIVLYTLNEVDADAINNRRTRRNAGQTSFLLHEGNNVYSGDVFPLVITRVWSEQTVNGQLLLDGNDIYWVTSAVEGDGARKWKHRGEKS